ncbi:MAG: hypothetical protein HW406_2143 [Candidatus Brocadiaceae bacterium]|nr:hypothetical protein [Candidatus Brocadiaceae bacterium]
MRGTIMPAIPTNIIMSEIVNKIISQIPICYSFNECFKRTRISQICTDNNSSETEPQTDKKHLKPQISQITQIFHIEILRHFISFDFAQDRSERNKETKLKP